MAGDKQRPTPPRRTGTRGAKRDRESMKKAGVTDAGIALVEALAELIDERFPTRQALIDALGDNAKKSGLDRKRLSKEMGSSAKPKGPDWHITALIVETCVDEPGLRRKTLAKMAGLYCVARSVQQPPGYGDDEPIELPSSCEQRAEVALHRVIDRLMDELNEKVTALVEIRSLNEGIMHQLTDQQMHLELQRRKYLEQHEQFVRAEATAATRAAEVQSLNNQIATLTQQVLTKEAELARAGRQTASQAKRLAAGEQEIERLGQEALHQSSQAAQLRTDMGQLLRTVASQQPGRFDPEALYKTLLAGDDARTAELRELCAQLAAAIERDFALAPTDLPADRWHLGSSPCPINNAARPGARALAAYLIIHQEYQNITVENLAATLGVPPKAVFSWLTAHRLPDSDQLEVLAVALGVDPTHALSLHDAAHRSTTSEAAFPDGFHPDRYGQIVGGISRDNPRQPRQPGSFVAEISGDTSHPPRSERDAGDNHRVAANGDSIYQPFPSAGSLRPSRLAARRAAGVRAGLKQLVLCVTGGAVVYGGVTVIGCGSRTQAVTVVGTVGSVLWRAATVLIRSRRKSRPPAVGASAPRQATEHASASVTPLIRPPAPRTSLSADVRPPAVSHPREVTDPPSEEVDMRMRAQNLAQALTGRYFGSWHPSSPGSTASDDHS
jgi:hypothetical protein